ncbi:amino acid ABC transporter substrate-binding protein [Cellulomonas edaphi]|uniref:Amino acid ABC transporter substrate-binding protein n=1 Tax=Cellulomonas edaphi TaxID=3053468 RepID=A0ABT7S5V7_9CELL|nr:amino acid ABC transporter substrate-binding protein [Cellulomons edaphi]MDM7830993.1 amino acid ABC transporter substrate-binding protein [Cellulomons edaphi]
MRSRTARRGAAMLVGLGLLVGACSSGGSGESETSGSGTPGADTSLADVKKAGVLVVATEGTYRPFSFHEGGSGDLTGFDVDIARAVGEKLGVDVKFEETQWDAIFAGLDAGRFDMIANQVTLTPERIAKYTFSTPYTVSTGVLVVRSDNTSISSFDDLKGKTSAQSLTSVWSDLAKEHGATVEAVEGWAQAVALVEQKRVDATINDKLTYLDYTTTENASGIKTVAETDDTSQSAFPFAKGSDSLVGAVNDALAELSADGTLAEISTKYFGEDVTH